jgi:hypothetical protein
MHSGFGSMRASMPFNVKAMFPKFKVWSRAESDVKRIVEIWTDCLTRYGGPFLFGKTPGMADAMYAPVVSRFRTYDIPLEKFGPALDHDDDLEICLMAVPARAFFWCLIGFDQMRNDLAMGGLGNAQIAVQKEVAQSVTLE